MNDSTVSTNASLVLIKWDFIVDDKKRFACIECGLELPISLATNTQAGERFHCSFCGAVYCGVLDENAPQELVANVQRAERHT